MKITLYAAPMSSATPVVWALKELEVPHELVMLELTGKVHKQPEFLKLNPNGKVSTLVVDGTPMFEAVAIMQWLGDRFGVSKSLWPAADAPARLTALSWSTWAYVTYGAAIHRLNYAGSPRVSPELHSPAQVAHYKNELRQLLDILTTKLEHSDYLLGSTFSLLDLIVNTSVTYGTYCGASIEAHPRIVAWSARCHDRRAFKEAWGG